MPGHLPMLGNVHYTHNCCNNSTCLLADPTGVSLITAPLKVSSLRLPCAASHATNCVGCQTWETALRGCLYCSLQTSGFYSWLSMTTQMQKQQMGAATGESESRLAVISCADEQTDTASLFFRQCTVFLALQNGGIHTAQSSCLGQSWPLCLVMQEPAGA